MTSWAKERHKPSTKNQRAARTHSELWRGGVGGGAAPACPSLSHMELSEPATAEGGRIPQRVDVRNRAAPEVTEPSSRSCLTQGKPTTDAPFSFSSPPAAPRRWVRQLPPACSHTSLHCATPSHTLLRGEPQKHFPTSLSQRQTSVTHLCTWQKSCWATVGPPWPLWPPPVPPSLVMETAECTRGSGNT